MKFFSMYSKILASIFTVSVCCCVVSCNSHNRYSAQGGEMQDQKQVEQERAKFSEFWNRFKELAAKYQGAYDLKVADETLAEFDKINESIRNLNMYDRFRFRRTFTVDSLQKKGKGVCRDFTHLLCEEGRKIGFPVFYMGFNPKRDKEYIEKAKAEGRQLPGHCIGIYKFSDFWYVAGLTESIGGKIFSSDNLPNYIKKYVDESKPVVVYFNGTEIPLDEFISNYDSKYKKLIKPQPLNPNSWGADGRKEWRKLKDIFDDLKNKLQNDDCSDRWFSEYGMLYYDYCNLNANKTIKDVVMNSRKGNYYEYFHVIKQAMREKGYDEKSGFKLYPMFKSDEECKVVPIYKLGQKYYVADLAAQIADKDSESYSIPLDFYLKTRMDVNNKAERENVTVIRSNGKKVSLNKFLEKH